MDKDNQYDDLDGLNSKPPPNNLPPIWEGIAGALDATDHTPMEEDNTPETDQEQEQQLADFALIKAGFVTTFAQKEPPKFLWDTIEQDLEAQVQTDAPTEFSTIKDSFLAAFGEQQPPQSLWQELAERVDQPEKKAAAEEKANYSKIKKSFERKYSAIVVPLFSWDDLAERMDAEAILADTPERFSCIKDSFEAVYANQEPSAAVAIGLWKRLYPLAPIWATAQQLGQSPWVKGAAVAVLLLLGWAISNPMRPVIIDSNTESSTSTKVQSSTSTTDIAILNNQEELLSWGNTANSIVKKNTTNYHLALFTPWLNLENPLLAQILPPQKNNSVISIEDITAISSTRNTTTPASSTFSNSNDKTAAIVSGEQPLAIHTVNTAETSSSLAIVAKKETTTPIKEKEEASTFIANTTLNNFSELSTQKAVLSTPILPAATIQLVEEGWPALSSNYIPDPAIAIMEINSFREVRPLIRGKKMHFEFGIEGRLGTSILLEKKGREAERETLLCPTGAAGVTFQYYFGKKDALVLGAYPYSTTIQCWIEEFPNGGGYKETALNLSFMDFTFGYQRVLFHYNAFTEVPASVYARLNMGVGWLTRSDTRVNQQAIHTPHLYENLNFNAGLAIGNLHQMQRFVLDYGLMGNIGLNSFITGSQPSVSKPARIVNVGAYIGLRYLFVPRRAPSKSQRQFDWSAPFYIEEPKF